MQASIIIATHNRAKYLSLCLKGLTAITTDTTTFEIIVVDNNSSDSTEDVIKQISETHPNITFKYIFEPQEGASRARNRGIEEACGKIVCFLDDDTIPSPNWLNAMVEGFSDSGVGCVGGPAILDFQGQKSPPWLQGDLKGLLSGYGLGYSTPTSISKNFEYPFLCNMAVRSNVLKEVGLFRLDLGPTGNNLVVGEETELIGRIRQAGWTVMYLPDARVRHLVTPERLKKQYIYRMGTRMAVTHIVLTWDTRFHMIMRWFASDLWYATRMFFRLVASILKRRQLWFDDYMRFWMVLKRIPMRIKALARGKDSITAANA